MLNAYIVESYIDESWHSQKGKKKRDYLKFWLDLANQLIGNHISQKLSHHRRSENCGNHDRLNTNLGHWPVQDTHKLWCVVCSVTCFQIHLPNRKLRHESRFKHSQCNVHLCIDIDKDRNFQKYHTVLDYSEYCTTYVKVSCKRIKTNSSESQPRINASIQKNITTVRIYMHITMRPAFVLTRTSRIAMIFTS